MWSLISALFLGWTLGFNDSANVVGTAVAVRVIDAMLAGIILLVFATLGAVVGGIGGMKTISSFGTQTALSAFVITLAAALAVRGANRFGIPVSTSQAVVGGVLGAGLVYGRLNLSPLVKVVMSWVLTPVFGALFAAMLYLAFRPITRPFRRSILHWDEMVWWGTVIAAAFGAYSLGANNVANVTGVFVAAGVLTPRLATILGGLFIGLGGLSVGLMTAHSHKIFDTVGRGIVKLDSYAAFIAILGESLAVWLFSLLGVPVSTTQALIGAVLGIGLITMPKHINWAVLRKVVASWVLSPLVAGIISAFGLGLCRLAGL